MDAVCFNIIRGPLDNRKRSLIIHPDYIEFDDKDLISAPISHFNKSSIEGFRLGVKWIKWVYFNIGREYQFYIKSKDGNIIKIYFKSFYGFKKKQHDKQYSDILSALWEYYFLEIAENYLQEYFRKEFLEINGVRITENNILFIPDGGLKQKNVKCIPLTKIGTRDYTYYFSFFSVEDNNIYKGLKYLDEWNVIIFKILLLAILKKVHQAN